jgi:hypothetical protein
MLSEILRCRSGYPLAINPPPPTAIRHDVSSFRLYPVSSSDIPSCTHSIPLHSCLAKQCRPSVHCFASYAVSLIFAVSLSTENKFYLPFGCVGDGDSCVTPLPRLYLLIQSATQRKAKPIRYSYLKFSLYHGATAPSGPGPPHYRGFTIILNYTPQSIGLLWTNNQLDAETSTCTTDNTYDRHPCPRWDSNPQSQQASGRRPTP